jgi:hypothetical protein
MKLVINNENFKIKILRDIYDQSRYKKQEVIYHRITTRYY